RRLQADIGRAGARGRVEIQVRGPKKTASPRPSELASASRDPYAVSSLLRQVGGRLCPLAAPGVLGPGSRPGRRRGLQLRPDSNRECWKKRKSNSNAPALDRDPAPC